MYAAFVILVALLGLLIGSFLNVVIHRVPAGLSVVRPRSRCPGCETEIRSRDNIPVISWLILRGRCRDCGEPISIRYPAVELLTAAVFAILAASIGFHADLPAFLYLGAVGVALAAIDLDTKRLPDALTKPSYVVGLVLLGAAAAVDDEWHALLRGVIGMVVLFAFYFVLMMIKANGMGYGDVKLAGVLGLYLAWVGWGALATGAFLGFAFGALVSVGLLLTRLATRKSKIPFGPFMLAGALVGIVAGQWIFESYLSASG